MLFVLKSLVYSTYEVFICSCMCKRLSSNSLINMRESERDGRSTLISLYTYTSSRSPVFFRKRVTIYACSHSTPYIPNMRDCSFFCVSLTYNSNRDELEALIHSHTSTHSLCSYIHIWTPTWGCCRGGDVVVIMYYLTWVDWTEKESNKNKNNNA